MYVWRAYLEEGLEEADEGAVDAMAQIVRLQHVDRVAQLHAVPATGWRVDVDTKMRKYNRKQRGETMLGARTHVYKRTAVAPAPRCRGSARRG